jgi:AraC-like DNA-binding protein
MRNFALFLNKMERLCDVDMPLQVGKSIAQQFVNGRWGLVDKNTNFQQMLQSFMSNEHLFSRQNSYWLEQAFGSWCLCNRSDVKPTYPGMSLNEWFRVAFLLEVCRHWLGNDWQPAKLSVMTEESVAKKYAELLLPFSDIHYGQASLSLELTGVTDLIPMTNRALKSRDISEILLLTESYCHLPHFTLDWLATLFGVTAKTLYRYLKDHSTSFREIKKSAVMKRSHQLLIETEETISDIAYQMGYDDVSNFNRMIKSICGLTPAQLRRGAIALS